MQQPLENIRLGTKHRLTENVTAGDYLRLYMDSLKQNQKSLDLLQEWKYIVGPTLYGHVLVEAFDEHRLAVRCDHPSFASAFRMQQRMILRRLKEKFPSCDIKSIQVY